MPIITLPKTNKTLSADAGTNLPDVLKENEIYPDHCVWVPGLSGVLAVHL